MTGDRTTRIRPDKTRLETWKEVAAFFGKTERTVKRWEKDRGLPIHRLPGASRSRIYAEIRELEAWLKSAVPEESFATDADEPAENVLTPDVVVAPSPQRKPALYLRFLVGIAAVLALLSMAVLLSAHFQSPRNPPKPEAEAAYLKGLDAFDDQGAQSLALALEAFQRAIDLSPDYAEAYVGLANSLMQLPEYGEAATRLSPSQAFREAETAARKAVVLDRKLGAAQATLGLSLYYGAWDVDGAQRAFKKALKLSPDNGLTRSLHARYLMLRGAFPEALSEINRALELNPSSAAVKADRALLLALNGRKIEALDMLAALIRDEPKFATAYLYKAEISYAMGDDQAACAAWIAAAELKGRVRELAGAKSGLAALKQGGREAMLRAMLDHQLHAPDREAPNAYETAAHYAALGDTQKALAALNEAALQREPEVIRIGLDPRFVRLKDEAEFTRFTARFIDKRRP